MRSIHILFVAVLMTALLSCTNETSPEDNSGEHYKAEGFVLLDANRPVFTYFKGKSSDTLYVPLNGSTGPYSVRFLDSDSNLLGNPDEAEAELAWSLTDPSSFYFTSTGAGKWDLNATGYRLSTSKFRLYIMHGSHPDFQSDFLTATVQDFNLSHKEPVGMKINSGDKDSLLAEAYLPHISYIFQSVRKKIGNVTDYYRFSMFDSKNRRFQPTGTAYSLQISSSDTNIAVSSAVTSKTWDFQIIAKSKGTAMFLFKVLKDNNIVYEFNPVKVEVEE